MEAIRNSFFRVIDPRGHWVGSGFLFRVDGIEAQPVLVTCAHVVADALENRSLSLDSSAPKGTFLVDFPNSPISSPIKAWVYQNDPNAWFPLVESPSDFGALHDIALINIDMIRPPEGVEPIKLPKTDSDLVGTKVFALQGAVKGTDYKTNFPVIAEGILQGQPGALIQLRSFDPNDRAFIEGGCSGSPLWTSSPEKVVGVVALADTKKNLAWVIPSSSLRKIFVGESEAGSVADQNSYNNTPPVIPFDFRPRSRELLLKRTRLEKEVNDRVDDVFLLYLHGEQNCGKSSEVQRLIESPEARLTKERTIWQTCSTGLEFSDMADPIAEDCLGIKQGRRFGARDLIRALKEREMYLVLDGYSQREHPTITPLVELAANLEKPTHVLVTTYDDPTSSDLEHCAVRIPRVDREDVIASIEALGAELTLEYAKLVDLKEYDAISANRIVNHIRLGKPVETTEADPTGRVTSLRQNLWSAAERQVMSCLSLMESSISDDFYELLCLRHSLPGWQEFKAGLQSESLIRSDHPRTFTIREYCRRAILSNLSDELVKEYHGTIAEVLYEIVGNKEFSGFHGPTIDVINSLRAIHHSQQGDVEREKRLYLLSKVKDSAARKGMHRQLSIAIGKEIANGHEFDPWLFIQLIQSEVALGRIESAFTKAKAAQDVILSEDQVNLNLVVSLCTQFASILSQAREHTLAGHILGVSKIIFPNDAISSGLVPIRDSLKAWCDGKTGKTANARKIGNRLLSKAKQAEGRRRWMQMGIESTRLGVLEASLGNFKKADRLLADGSENFSKCDRRGEIWALSHLCFLRVSISPTKIPVEEFERLFDLHSTTLLISENTFRHFESFELALQGHPLHAKLVALSKEFAQRYQEFKLSEFDIEYAEAFVEVIQRRFGAQRASQNKNMINELINSRILEGPATTKHSPVDIVLCDNPKQVLATLYEEVPREELLNSPFYSRVLTTGLLRTGDEILIDRFVEAHLPSLIASRRLARLNYASFFERCDRPSIALRLLGTLRAENSFRFHNVSANCYKKLSFDNALFHNEKALSKASSPQERSRIHNNIAALYLQHDKADSEHIVSSNLKRSIDLRSDHFYWPYRTKLAADLTYGSTQDYTKILSEYVQTQRLSRRAIKYVASLLSDPEKKMRFLDLSLDFLT